MRGHHVIAKSTLRARGLVEYLWDRRNRMALCDRHHRRHHNRREPVPVELVSNDNWEFARIVGLDYLIDRYYRKEDDGDRLFVSHFATCPEADSWRK